MGSETDRGEEQASGHHKRNAWRSEAARDELELAKGPKKWQQNTIRGGKKGDKKETGEPVAAVVPGTSKQAKANNGEQISMIVHKCLKPMAPLLFAKQGGARESNVSR
ncbi:hypothetical protein NDU88_002614 [Pleurodeles waltl]|uniref:Uncharacterized protein n=1 Tax=Pleurodeles waltl TaxID=8319 RepID=A0AAV7TL13_PLEWA|nr:hypothetical protein NDU88_002614 [Pleurodeles waltl]